MESPTFKASVPVPGTANSPPPKRPSPGRTHAHTTTTRTHAHTHNTMTQQHNNTHNNNAHTEWQSDRITIGGVGADSPAASPHTCSDRGRRIQTTPDGDGGIAARACCRNQPQLLTTWLTPKS